MKTFSKRQKVYFSRALGNRGHVRVSRRGNRNARSSSGLESEVGSARPRRLDRFRPCRADGAARRAGERWYLLRMPQGREAALCAELKRLLPADVLTGRLSSFARSAG